MESTPQESVDIQLTEQTTEKKKYSRPSKHNWDRSTITLETKLIELPKKNARLAKPEYEACEKKIKEVEDQIKHTIERKKKIIEELILKSRENAESGNSKSAPLREQFNEKKEVKTQLQKEFEEAKQTHNDLKNKINELTEKQRELKLKIKGNTKPEELEERLEEVEFSLNNDTLSLPEEKKLVKEREELLLARPYALPIKKISLELEELNKKRKEIKPILDAAYEKYNTVRLEVSGIAVGLDEIRQAKNQDKEKTDPLFGEIRAEYDAKIEALKKQKSVIRDEFRVARDKYEDEQDDIRYYDWAKRIQDSLRRNKQFQDREAQIIAEEAAAEKRKIDAMENPNQALINDCDMLLKYCSQLVKVEVNPEVEETQEKAPEREVNLADLKKEKLEIMAPKKEIQKFPANKKKQQPVKKQNKPAENVRQILNLPLDIINAFESVKVKAPIFIEEVQTALDVVREKQAQLQEQGDKELASKKEALLNGTHVVSNAGDNAESSSQKKATKVYHEKEIDFPTL